MRLAGVPAEVFLLVVDCGGLRWLAHLAFCACDIRFRAAADTLRFGRAFLRAPARLLIEDCII